MDGRIMEALLDGWILGREGEREGGEMRAEEGRDGHTQTPTDTTHSLSLIHPPDCGSFTYYRYGQGGRPPTHTYCTTTYLHTILCCTVTVIVIVTITIAAAAAGSTPLDRRQGALQCRAVDGRTFVRLFVCSCVLYCNCTVL